jgi:hypothetical protein
MFIKEENKMSGNNDQIPYFCQFYIPDIIYKMQLNLVYYNLDN